MTQSQLGELIGVKRSQISKLEHGNHSASVSTIMKVFQAMKAKVRLRIETDDYFEFAFNNHQLATCGIKIAGIVGYSRFVPASTFV